MDVTAPQLRTFITPRDLNTEQMAALDAWADDQDVYLYGWQSLEMLDEGEVEVHRVDYIGCGYSDTDDEIYQVTVPPPIPQPGLSDDAST
jgi:hypothetical protein